MISDDPYGEIQMLVSGLPDSARSVVAKAREFRQTDAVDFALMLLERAVSVAPVPIVLAERADLLASEGRLADALDASLQAAVSDPTNHRVREVLQRVLVNALPESADHMVEIARVFAEEDEEDFAEELLRSAVLYDPGNIDSRLRLARFCADHGRYTGSIIELRAVLKAEPHHADAQLLLAESLLANRDVPGARRWLTQAKANGADATIVAALERRLAAASR